MCARFRRIVEHAVVNEQRVDVQVVTTSEQFIMPLNSVKTCLGMQKTPAVPVEDGMTGTGMWARVKRGITLDSGCSVFVMPSSWLPQFRLEAGAKKGSTYVAANKGIIVNEGERTITFTTDEGQVRKITFQVAGVNKPLASVAGICDAGHIVTFTKDGGTIRNVVTGEVTKFQRRGNVYVMNAWVQRERGDAGVSTGFTRPVTP